MLLETTRTMRSYTELRKNFGNVLPHKMAKVLALTIKPAQDWFIDTYQNKTRSTHEAITLGALLDAVHRSEEEFKQYPVDKRNVKTIAIDLYITENWLKRPPYVARIYDGRKSDELYIVGGRHRTYAITAGLAQLSHLGSRDELDANDMFETMLDCKINVDLIYVPDLETLTTLVRADNDSRTMRGAELAHIKSQMLGVRASDIDSLADTAVGNENLTPKEVVQMVAQTFTRRHHRKLKPQTLQVIGEKVAAWTVYGVHPGGRITRKAQPVHTSSEVDQLMKQGYAVMCDLVSGMEVVAKNATEVAEQVIVQLGGAAPVVESEEEEEDFVVGEYGVPDDARTEVSEDERQEVEPSTRSAKRRRKKVEEPALVEAAGVVDAIF